MASTSRVPYGRDGNDRASSVASSSTSTRRRATARGVGNAARMSQEPVASTSRGAARGMSVSSTPADDHSSANPTSEATIMQDETPTVAAYQSRARVTRSGSTTPPLSAVVKRPPLTEEQRRRDQLRKQQEDQEDNFFTRKTDFVFVKKSAPARKTSRQPSIPQTGPSTVPHAEASATPPPSSPDKGKQRALVIELDDDDDDSDGGASSDSSAEDSEDDPYSKQKKKVAPPPAKSKKKAKVTPRKASPIKRPIALDSSSSSSSTYDSSSSQGTSMRKKKKKGPPIAQESASTIFDHDRSLSPIEQIDASRIANAIANVRQSRPRNMIDDDDDEIALIRGGSRGPRDDALTSPSRAVNGSPEAALRSPSASILQQGNGDAFRAQRPCVLATLPEVKEETEEEKRSKYGHIIVVTIEMVFDPRVQIYDGMRAQVVQYEQPIDFKMRQRESFSAMFDAVSKEKGMPRDQLAFTYNGHNLFSSGTPKALNFTSNGYTKDVLQYIRAHGLTLGSASINGAANSSITSTINSGRNPLGVTTMSMEQTANAMNDALRQAASAAGPSGDRGGAATADPLAQASPSAERDDTVKLCLRGGPDQKVLMAVPKARTVLSVIKAFLRKSALDQTLAPQCKIFFDGEEISHSAKIGETDVEDEDTLDIKVPH